MSVVENLFMQIFDRRDWIADQLRQQVQSYGQSVASNLAAEGGRPPPWLWTSGSDAPDCLLPQEFCREQLISGILNPLPSYSTPLVSRSFLFSQPVPKTDYALQSGFLTAAFATKHLFVEDVNKVDPGGCPVGSLYQDMPIEPEVVETNPERMLSEIQQSGPGPMCLENLVSAKGKTKDCPSKSNHNKNTGQITRSRSSSEKRHYVNESPKLKNSASFPTEYDPRVDKSRSVAQKQVKFDNLSSKSSELLEQVEDDGVQKISKSKKKFFPHHPVMYAHDANEIVHQKTCHEKVSGKQQNLAFQSKITSAIDTMSPVITGREPRQLVFDFVEELIPNESLIASLESEKHDTYSKTSVTISVPTPSVDVSTVSKDSEIGDVTSRNGQLHHDVQMKEAINMDRDADKASDEGKQIIGLELTEAEKECNSPAMPFHIELPHVSAPPCNEQALWTCESGRNCTNSVGDELLNSALDFSSHDDCHRDASGYISSGNKDTSNNSFMRDVSEYVSHPLKTHYSSGSGLPSSGGIKDGDIEFINRRASQQERTLSDSLVQNPKSEAKYFSRSSSTHDKKPTASPLKNTLMISSENDTILSDDQNLKTFTADGMENSFMEHIIIPNTDGNGKASVQEQCFLRSSTSHGHNVGLTLPNSKNDVMLVESQETVLQKEVIADSSTDRQPSEGRYFLRSSTSTRDIQKKCVLQKTVIANSSADGQPVEGRYFLRSSTSTDKKVPSTKSFGSCGANLSSKLKKAIPLSCEMTWPTRSKMDGCLENTIGANQLMIKPLMEACDHRNTKGTEYFPEPMVECHRFTVSDEMDSELLSAKTGSPSEDIHQRKKLRLSEVVPDTEGENQEQRYDSGHNILEMKNPHTSHNGADLVHLKTTSIHGSHECFAGNVGSGKKSSSRVNFFSHDPAGSLCPDKASFDFSVQTMPEFEGFCIEAPSDREDDITFKNSDFPSPACDYANALEEQCRNRNLPTPLPYSSAKYKIHKVPDGILEPINLSNSFCFNSIDSKKHRACEDGQISDIYGNLEFNDSLVERTGSQYIPSFGFLTGSDSRRPFTPPIEKEYHKVTLETSGASSEKVSKPELTCFRIDENVSTIGEDEFLDELDMAAQGRVSSSDNIDSTNRKALADVTSLYQNAPSMASTSEKCLDRGSLDSVSTEAYYGLQVTAQSKENGYSKPVRSNIEDKSVSLSASRKAARKGVLSLQNRSSKPSVSVKVRVQQRSHATTEKGCKPTNIVANISSFIPLVQKKQQAAVPAAGKRDIRVKALEAAEAAKRLEAKKEGERKLKKEAARLERMRLEQENIKQLALEQKQKEEERRKKEAQVEARKRQREEEEKKEKQRKRRCIEETLRQRKELDRLRADEKEFQQKAAVQKKTELKNDFKVQQHPEKVLEFAEANKQKELDQSRIGRGSQEVCNAAIDTNDSQKMASSSLTDMEVQNRRLIIKESRESQSYEISPYRDSDGEDGEEDSKQKRKFIPLWARRESLAQQIYSQKDIDAGKIFQRKNFFSLNEVLSGRVRPRPYAQQ